MSIIYLNNLFLNEKNATISVFDRGFLFGDGFFETIRCQNNTILFLNDHLDRLAHSCKEFQIRPPDSDKMGSVIKRLLMENKLNNSIAAAKIIITRGITNTLHITPSDTPTLIVTVRPYQPFPESLYQSGLSMVPFPYAHQTFLAKHKSLNYLFYINALSFAKQKGAHDAIIMDPRGNVLEGAISNLLLSHNSTIIAPPPSMDFLPGVTEKNSLNFLRANGFTILQKSIKLSDLYAADEIILTNSLLLSAPVNKIGDKHVSHDRHIASLLREHFQNI